MLYYAQDYGRGDSGMREDGAGRFGRGASIMVASVFISKLLGLLVVVPLQNIIGGYAYGIFRIAYPLYTIMLTLATIGFPLALSKTISQLSAAGKHREAYANFRAIGRFMLIFGAIAFLLMWFGAPLYLTVTLPHDSRSLIIAAIPAIHTLAPALLLLPLISIERGYLQGYLRLEASGASQVVDQVARVTFILIGTVIAALMGVNASTKAAIATFGATVGVLGAFLLLRVSVRKLRKETLRKSKFSPYTPPRAQDVFRQLFVYALPIATGTLVLPLAQAIDAWTIPRLLVASGATMVKAITDYGIYTGEALILMQLPLSFANAIGASIMPALTESRAAGVPHAVRARLNASLKMMAFITFPAALTLGLLAKQINIALFASSSGTVAIAIAGIMSIFSALELVSTYILQGYDRFYRPVVHMFVGLAIKLALNILLIPFFGINGAAIASTIGYLISAWLNMRAVRHFSGARVQFPKIAWRALAACLFVGAWFLLWQKGIAILQVWQPQLASMRIVALLEVLVALFVGAPIYLFFALRFRAVSGSELSKLPLVGKLLIRT